MSLADETRKIPGATTVESAATAVAGALSAVGDAVSGTVTGLVSSEQNLPITNYDKQKSSAIMTELRTLSQHDLSVVAAYEARHENRVTIIDRISALKAVEPWRGYDEQTVAEITTALATHDSQTAAAVGVYERDHKERAGVLQAVGSHEAA